MKRTALVLLILCASIAYAQSPSLEEIVWVVGNGEVRVTSDPKDGARRDVASAYDLREIMENRFLHGDFCALF